MSGADADGSGAAARADPGPPRALLAAAIEALATRLELASVELEIHLIGLLRVMLWALAAMLCALVALAFGVVALIAALWSTHRLLGLAAGSLTFVVLALLFGLLGARAFRLRPPLLAGSLAQLDTDQKRTAGAP
jgi:uncharacterized membrane protein YqjE